VKWLYALGAVVAALLMLRETLLLTRGHRTRRAMEAASRPSSLRSRLARRAAMPVFLLLVAGAAMLGMMAGVLVGPH
jgi:hypothetical protein